MKHLLIPVLAAIIFSVACTPYKQVPYFKNLPADSIVSETVDNFRPLQLQRGDLLGVNVTSLNHEADLLFNYDLTELRPPGSERSSVVGYLINQDGYIHLPLVGNIKAAGLTTEELSASVAAQIETYLSKPVVNVRLLNFKVSVLGDVGRPGSFPVQSEKITFMEALSLAGDLNTTGMRENVLLIREENGLREYIHINLNSKEILNSPYYYLKNNDVIYVQPNKAKVAIETGLIAKIGVAVSVLSIIAYLIRFQ